ncbi:MAG: hypothetical protein IKL62_05010 [Clostridia bacterium]|nr:hypothetical protein [Clostridia bacterium]
MKKFSKLKKFLWGFGSFCFCFALYMSIAFLMLGTENKAAKGSAESVPYGDSANDFSVLLSCEELNQYCAVTVYPEKEQITMVLFDSLYDARGYEENYSRYVKYRKKTEIDIIGRVGGIVINSQTGYNESNNNYIGQNSSQRLFGSRVLELAATTEMRREIAREVMASLLSTNLDQTDFNFIFATCETDISYIDFCEYFPILQSLCENITVTIG